jgi:hypothetical protein
VAGTVTGTVRIQSDAVTVADVIVPLSGTGMLVQGPGILVVPRALDFGEIELGQNLVLSVEVRNAGTEVLDLTEIGLEAAPGLGFTLSGVPVLPTSLDPGDSFSVDVGYAPPVVGLVTSRLRIVSNAVNGAEVAVPVVGIGRVLEAQIEVLSVALDFRAVELGENLTLSVEIRNVGDADLEWRLVDIAAEIDTEFILGDIPGPVAPGEVAFIDVTYQPTGLGPAIGALQLQSNAVNTPQVSVTLSGTGVGVSQSN